MEIENNFYYDYYKKCWVASIWFEQHIKLLCGVYNIPHDKDLSKLIDLLHYEIFVSHTSKDIKYYISEEDFILLHLARFLRNTLKHRTIIANKICPINIELNFAINHIAKYGCLEDKEIKDEAPSGTMPCPIPPEDSEKAKLAAEWAESLPDEDCDQSDYLHNIRAIARSGMVGIRTSGFAASIIAAYDREVAKHQPKQISSYVGVIKMREDFDLTLKNIYAGQSNWGGYTRYTFQDDRGNVLTWTSSIEQRLEVNKKYRIRGTVKNHSEFKGEKRTELNRCNVEMYHE